MLTSSVHFRTFYLFRIMLIILSNKDVSLTGSLNSNYGYHLERRKNGIFGKRNQRGYVPPDGHWRFILDCARLARTKLFLADIRLTPDELYDALVEANHWNAAESVERNAEKYVKSAYNAQDIINLQRTFGL